MADEHFLTTDEVLDYLQVNLRTIYRLIKAGRIPAVRVGRQWRFRKQDVDAWLSGSRRVRRTGPGSRSSPPPKILVVDDEEPVRNLISRALIEAKYDVDTATDGPSALDRLRAADYDLLITDLKMPGMDGLSVIREVRRQQADLPIIIITGFSSEASAIEALNLGVNGYLTKPFRLPRILAVTAKALGQPAPAAEA
jgi:excisionase family DNA binding protein